MRILLLGLNFHPELIGIGKYTGELACYLSHAGHNVRVVTSPPYYPNWSADSGYRWWQYRREEWQGIRIYRTPLWVPHKPTGIKRLLHLFSFAISSFPVLMLQLPWRPDVVMCIAPTLFSAPSVWLFSRFCSAKSWLHVQDFELETAIKLGILPTNSLLARWAFRTERWLFSLFDRVSTISRNMLERLSDNGVDRRRLVLFPNWFDPNSIYPLSDSHDALCNLFGLPSDKVIVLYSGNMGYKQGLELVVEAARRLLTCPQIRFVLCGDGAAREELERAARGLANVQFISLQPPQRLNQLLNTADIHLLPQKADAADLVMPSKLLGMLASGKAVIATAGPDTEIGEVILKTGVLVPPGEIEELCEAILNLTDAPESRNQYGKKGREYACEHWSSDKVLSEFLTQLFELVRDQSPDIQCKYE